MKVYIVIKDNWNSNFISLFSTRKKANDFLEKRKYNPTTINVVEYELNSEEEI